MIKRRKKICLDCNELKYLFGKNLCQYCYNIKFKKPINKVSEKQERILKAYRELRKEYLIIHPFCEARIKCRGSKSTDIHHKAGKASEELYLNTEYWLSSCRKCHNYIEEHPTEAKSLGFSLIRTNK